jgi:predicted nuclease with TOPRIM domain
MLDRDLIDILEDNLRRSSEFERALRNEVSELRAEIARLQALIASSDVVRANACNSIEGLQAEVADWKKKYEELLNNEVPQR